ncbi:MAG: EVE domain-containing protein [Kofleriaceae bacterium]|nr:EVE domain-containing protein [Kofleriaceae bacterium]
MKYWLMKSEPDTFSITDLERVKIEPWTGVRSFFARAHMRAMSIGDQVLFYHSNAKPPGVAGFAKVVRTGVIDETQFDPKSPYFDEKATREGPIWDCVDVEYVSTAPHFVSLDRLRADPKLADMVVLKPGRLSVQPVSEAEYQRVVELANIEAPVVAKQKPVAKKKRVAKKPAPKKKIKGKR